MNNIQKINDIKYLIMENYSDKEPLSEEQKASKQCFFNYCDDIRKDLEKLKEIEEIFVVTKISLQTILDTKITLQTNIIDPTIIKAQVYDKMIEVFKNDR